VTFFINYARKKFYETGLERDRGDEDEEQARDSSAADRRTSGVCLIKPFHCHRRHGKIGDVEKLFIPVACAMLQSSS
jgi:hypothetical protein